MKFFEDSAEALEIIGGTKRRYPEIADVWYWFIGPWGKMKLTYAQYLLSPELRRFLNDKSANFRLEIGRRIYCYPKRMIAQDTKLKASLEHLDHERQTNPLQFFMPNGSAGLDFLNDTTSSLKMFVAGNRYGKTTISIIDMLLDIVPCNPEWLIFKENGVKFRPYDGVPRNWGCASYMWRHITTTVAPLVIQWAPDEVLGVYAKSAKKRREVNAEKRPFIELTNDAKVQFFVYEQPQENFESAALAGWMWDEQPTEAKFDGADERTRTLHGRHNVAMTPHKVKGRADTGAGTWLHAAWKGDVSKGHSIGRYKAHTFDNPDWNYPESDKNKAFVKWVVEPAKHHDRKKLDEGRSRLEGEFHSASGLVYDDICEDIHFIQPFQIPEHWTKYRAIDHGHKNPTAAVMAAVTPSNDVIVYDEYYCAGKTVYENAKAIVEQSGNTLYLQERRSDIGGNTEYDVYEESRRVPFEWTKLDGRSFNFGDPATGRKYGELYRDAGIDVTPARGGDHTVRVPLVGEFLRVDYDRPHLITKKPGGAKVYFFTTCKHFKSEIMSYHWAEEKETTLGVSDPKPVKKNDHLVNAVEYLLMSGPTYRGEYQQKDLDQFYEGMRADRLVEDQPKERVNRITGY